MTGAPRDDGAADSLRSLSLRIVGARIATDDATLESIVGEAFLGSTTSGQWRTRGDWLDGRPLHAEPTDTPCGDATVRRFGDVALVHGTVRIPSARASGAMEGHVRYTHVLARRAGAWTLVGAHHTAVAAEVPLQEEVGTMPVHGGWRREDPAGDDLDTLSRLNAGYVQAYRDANVAWYDAHCAADYCVVQSDGALHDRAAALSRFALPHFATHMRSFPVDHVRIRRFGDVALIHAENAYELKDGRRGVSRYTDAWLKRDGRWWCIAAHITPHAAPA